MSDDLQLQRLAAAYFKLLTAIDWDDDVLVDGLREGLNKFLSNAHLAAFRGKHKYYKTHLVTAAALASLQAKSYRDLVCEHLVPKTRYIQAPCEARAREGILTIDFVYDLLLRYWKLATITVGEDQRLARLSMPVDWDGVNVEARYRAVGIELLPNPYYGSVSGDR